MAEEEVDIISTLPDDILCHILSFLQTKQYVTTSILSKRWKNLWRSVPSLNLGHIDLRNEYSYDTFLHFVNSVLLFQDPPLPINTFDVHLNNSYRVNYPHRPFESITKWINIVVQRGVQYIDLYCLEVSGSELPRYLPISILTCTTLVVLKINAFIVEKVFSPVTLPSLKTLHLYRIMFAQLRDFMLVLAGCPILEDLFTCYVGFESEVFLTCDEWKNFSLSHLTKADIHCVWNNHFLLKLVHNVSSLCLQIDQDHYVDGFLPIFHNLTQLDFFCSFLHDNWELLVKVLKHCPKLQKLRVTETEDCNYHGNSDDNDYWVDPNFVPQCLSLHLRTCYFTGCFGRHGPEIMIAKYILKNAKVLQTMKVRNTRPTKINQQLSSCPRASAICKLTVYNVPG